MQRSIDLLLAESEYARRLFTSQRQLLSPDWHAGFRWAIDTLKAKRDEEAETPYDLPGYAEQGIIPEQEWERRAEEAVGDGGPKFDPYAADIAAARQRQHDAEEMKRKAQAYDKAGITLDNYRRGVHATSEPILDMTSQARAKRPWVLG